jgi:hypothetical protein
LVERTANYVLAAVGFYQGLPFLLAELLAACFGFELDAKTIVRPGGVKQYRVGNPGGHSFALHYRGFPCVPRPTVRNGEKKAGYGSVLKPEPRNAILL